MTTLPNPSGQGGFTLLELGLVLIVMGILTAAAIPLITVAHRNLMREQDRQILETAKNAIIGYARANRGLPPCLPNASASGCDHEQMYAALGVKWRDSKNGGGNGISGMNLYYFPSPALTAVNSICTNPSPAITSPETCFYTEANPCVSGSSAKQAFVLVAYGDDNAPNGNNTAAAVASPTTSFDSAQRPPNFDGANYYDDIVISMSLTDLVARICPPSCSIVAPATSCTPT